MTKENKKEITIKFPFNNFIYPPFSNEGKENQVYLHNPSYL